MQWLINGHDPLRCSPQFVVVRMFASLFIIAPEMLGNACTLPGLAEHLRTTKQHVHTLNSTAIATSRVMRAILENFQDNEGRVEIPGILRPYMNNQEYL